MWERTQYLIAILLLLIVLPLSAQEGTNQEEINLEEVNQEETKQSEDIWISLGGEIAMYSPSSVSYGGSITIAYGSGTSIGIKASWLFDQGGEMNVMELNFLFRLYFFGKSANSGPSIQIEGGPAIFFDDEGISLPARIGMINLGAAVGWRFLLGKYFFIEPSIRGGYPYIFGASLLAGVHF